MTISSFAREIWSLKWLAALVGVALFAVMAIAVFSYRPTIDISILFNRLPMVANSQFLELNSSLDKIIRPRSDKEDEKFAERYTINNDLLFTNFLEIISRKQQFSKIMKGKVAEEFASDPSDEIEIKTLDRIRDIKITPPNNKSKWGTPVDRSALELRVEGWTLATQSKDPDNWVVGVFEVFAEAEKQAKAQTVKNIKALIEETRLTRKFALEDLERRRVEAIKEYDTQLKNRVAQLAEYAKIARSLDIASNTIATIPVGSNPTVVTSVNENAPPYFLGYKALEEQVGLMTNRSDKNLFINKLVEIDASIRNYKNDPRMDRAEQLLSNSRLNDDSFNVVEYGEERVETSKQLPRAVLVILAAVFSVILAVLFVTMVIGIRWLASRNSENSSPA